MGTAAERGLKLRDSGTRAAMKRDVEERPHARTDWRHMTVVEVVQEHNRQYEGLSIEDLAARQQKDPLDALLDLALDEGLQTTFSHQMSNRGDEALARRISSPYSHISLSDGGATHTLSHHQHLAGPFPGLLGARPAVGQHRAGALQDERLPGLDRRFQGARHAARRRLGPTS